MFEWSREAETFAQEEEIGLATIGAYQPERISLKTFPNALYQWSTIDSNNKLTDPLIRNLVKPCNQLGLSEDLELFIVIAENSATTDETYVTSPSVSLKNTKKF